MEKANDGVGLGLLNPYELRDAHKEAKLVAGFSCHKILQ